MNVFVFCLLGYAFGEVVDMKTRRIFGGIPASEGEFPYVALFGYKVPSYHLIAPVCGGAILNAKHIVTASHCLEPPELKGRSYKFIIMVGSKDSVVESGTWYYIQRTFLTDNQIKYGPPVDDIVLIRIWGSFNFNDNIKPIAITTSKTIPMGASAVVTGWGQYTQHPRQENSATLLAVMMTVVPNDKCTQYWKKFDASFNICVESPYNTGTCNGDSGGPLVIDNKLYGLLSYGHSQCGNGVPEVYINVASYRQWIYAKMHEQ